MTQALASKDVVQSVVQEALEQADSTGGDASHSAEMVEALRRDFPQARISVISLTDLLEAVQQSAQNQDT